MQKLANKNIVISGASSGIGEKMAIKVADMGARPILLARSKEKLNAICEKINKNTSVNCTYYELDVSDFKQVKAVFNQIIEDIGQIDILVNNAGFGIFDSFTDANFEDIQKMFEVNVLGLIACTKEVLPAMIERGGGHIINIASQAGKVASPKSSGYSSTKHAVLGFTNSLRMELAKSNIFVTAVNPGPIETDFFTLADKSGNYVKNVKNIMLKPEDVAGKVVQIMMTPRRELNIPSWMNIGSTLYNLLPAISERLARRIFDKK